MNSGLFLTIFAVYILFLIVLSWFVSRQHKTGEAFLLSNRGVPFSLTLGTTVATMVGTGSSMGAVGFAYSHGWAGACYGIGGALGILLLAVLFAPVRKLNFMTMSEELSYYTGANLLVKHVVAVLIFVAGIGWLGVHIIGGSLYLSWVTDIDIQLAKIVVAMAFAIYVVIGGYSAVVWTDTIQAVILFFGFILMAWVSIEHVGGLDGFIEASSASSASTGESRSLGALPGVSLAVVVMVGLLATPSYRQRIYTGTTVQSVRRSFLTAGFLYLLFSFIPAAIGISAFAIEPTLEQEGFALPFLALEVLPAAIAMIVLIAGLSATMSSASSDAIAGVVILLRDIVELATGRVPDQKDMLLLSRLGLCAIIGAALVLALTSNDIVDYIAKMISTTMSGLFVCSILGRLWPAFNWQGALACLIAASATSIAILSFEPVLEWFGNPVIPSVVVSFAAGFLVSICTPESPVSPRESLRIISQRRKQMEHSGS